MALQSEAIFQQSLKERHQLIVGNSRAGAFSSYVVLLRIQPVRPDDSQFDKAVRDNQERLQRGVLGGKLPLCSRG